MTALATPSPYLRDRLLQAADGLRKDAEHARLNLSEAEQDVAAAHDPADEDTYCESCGTHLPLRAVETRVASATALAWTEADR